METLFIGHSIIFLPEVDSTNSYATELLNNVNVSEGTLVHTSNQTQGRGLRGNSWVAETACNLTASIILKPNFLNLKHSFFLYKITALACYDVMAELLNNSQFDIKIKWPNDILVNKKKIAGILIENGVSANTLNYSVVGVGINLNQKEFNNGINATSIYNLLDKEVEVNTVLYLVFKYLEKYYLQLKNNKFNEISEIYLTRLYGLNCWMDFEINSEIKTYLVKGISNEGLLVLESRTAKESQFDVKEIKWLI
jgi:BirA family biotin operon repressor/biotin-[acetyl-CoA-carboxylase] ligase